MSEKTVVTPVDFKEEHIGKVLNMSKRRYTWVFDIGGQNHVFKLTMSLLSAKFSVSYDQNFAENGTRSMFDPFFYEARTNGLHFRVIEYNLSYDLYINKQQFKLGQQIVLKRETTQLYLKEGTLSGRPSINGSPIAKGSDAPVLGRSKTNPYSIFDRPSDMVKTSSNGMVSESNERYLSNLFPADGQGTPRKPSTAPQNRLINIQALHDYESVEEAYLITDRTGTTEERKNLFDKLYRR